MLDDVSSSREVPWFVLIKCPALSVSVIKKQIELTRNKVGEINSFILMNRYLH